MDQKTVLYDTHVNLGGKMVPYGGFIMPVQYEATGVIKEHNAVRESVGLFDVSHMGLFFVVGKDALKNVQNLLCNDYENMKIGACRYSPMLNENGGIVDDLLVYKISEEEYMFVVNAANRPKDAEWMTKHITGDAKFEDRTPKYGILALQGPKSQVIIEKLMKKDDIPTKNYSFINNVDVAGVNCLVSMTGYTGEDGFEFYVPIDECKNIWNKLMDAGKEFNIVPAGLGSRDSLRLEASMPLYGNEMTDDITPFEAGLGFFVKMDKENFIGKEALEKAGKAKRLRTGLEIVGRGIARGDAKVFDGDKEVGIVTSGTLTPYLNKAVAMALVDVDSREVGKELAIDVRGRKLSAKVIAMPFYKK